MGCRWSTPIQEINAEESEAVDISKENSANGSADQARQVKADGFKKPANSLQDTNPTGGNQLGQAKSNSSLKGPRAKRGGEQIIDNAWGISRGQKNIESSQSEPGPEGLIDLESEYGKDGVDLTSSHVHGDHEVTEKVFNKMSGARRSTDETYSVNNSERLSKQQSIHKVNTMTIN